MHNDDELLQQKLTEMENGAELDSLLQDLPEDAQELSTLLQLAAAVREIPHPEPALNQVAAQRQQVMAAAMRNTQPAKRDQASGVQSRSITWNGKPQSKSITWNMKWVGAGAVVAAAGAFMVLFVVAIAGIGLWFSSNNRNTARVEAITGQVQVSSGSSAAAWKNVSAGYRVRQGDHLRTLGASTATLAYFEGTHTFVSPNSELTFANLKGGSGQTLQVKIDQNIGETWNKVTPFNGNKKSYFLVQTPSGTASVHGTSFNVKISQSGQAQFAVNTGVVNVQNDGNQVTLNAGQTSSATPTGEITEPAYQFNIQGSLTDIDEAAQVWTVSGMQFKVTETTSITGAPQLGDMVQVNGRILDDQSRVADSIEPADNSSQTAYFTGTLESNTGEDWQVGGMAVKVTAETQLDPSLATGDPVKVTFNLLDDGTYLALKIESLVERPEEPVPTPTMTADPNAMPSYEFTPDEVETSACGSRDFNLTGTLRNTAENTKDYAANVQLGYLIERGGEFVNTVELSPDNLERMDAGQSVSFNIHVTTNEAWDAAGEDAQIKLSVIIASATNRPDHLNGRLMVTIESGCKQTPTPSGTPSAAPTGSQTPELNGTPTPIITLIVPTPTQAQAYQCTGANPHPTGLKLAQRYGVSYEEIMKWFCKHYGFGEIDLAYTLSRQSGKSVEEIFAMRAAGKGWGEIKKFYAPDGKHNSNNENDQGEDQGNGKNKDKGNGKNK